MKKRSWKLRWHLTTHFCEHSYFQLQGTIPIYGFLFFFPFASNHTFTEEKRGNIGIKLVIMKTSLDISFHWQISNREHKFVKSPFIGESYSVYSVIHWSPWDTNAFSLVRMRMTEKVTVFYSWKKLKNFLCVWYVVERGGGVFFTTKVNGFTDSCAWRCFICWPAGLHFIIISQATQWL